MVKRIKRLWVCRLHDVVCMDNNTPALKVFDNAVPAGEAEEKEDLRFCIYSIKKTEPRFFIAACLQLRIMRYSVLMSFKLL